jgi:hypothetical protein
MVMKRKALSPSLATGQRERVQVTEGAAQSVLRRGAARALTPEEERVMRMRLGASPPRSAPLQRSAEGLGDLEIEVYAAEIEAYMKWKAWEEERSPRARAALLDRPGTIGPPPVPSRTKEKIVRALRKKT